MGLLLLTLIVSALTLHSWFFIEIQFNGVALKEVVLTKLDKNKAPIWNIFLINAKIFIYYFLTVFRHVCIFIISYYFSSLNTYKCL